MNKQENMKSNDERDMKAEFNNRVKSSVEEQKINSLHQNILYLNLKTLTV